MLNLVHIPGAPAPRLSRAEQLAMRFAALHDVIDLHEERLARIEHTLAQLTADQLHD